MKLSIVVLFSDRDKNLFRAWFEQTQKNVEVEHEVIAVDNTSDGSLEQIEGAKVVRGGRDVGCFAGRKLGFKQSVGQYIWYCDGDDETLPLKAFDYTADLVCFNYLAKHKGEEEKHICKDPYVMPYKATAKTFYHAYWKNMCKNMVWNKFIRRELLENIYNAVPDFELYTSEDAFLSVLLEMTIRSVEFDNKAFYLYYLNNGMSENTITDIERFKRVFRGTKEAWACYKLMTTDEQRAESGIRVEDLMIGLCKYALDQNKWADAVFKDYCKFLVEYFSFNMVSSVLEIYKDEYKQNYYRIKRHITDFNNEVTK